MSDGHLMLPADILTWVEEVARGPVSRANRVPGGATREAWHVDVTQPDGTVRPLFVRYSADRLPARSAFHPLAVEAEMMTALRAAGVTVPNVLAVHPTREAILSDRVSGATWFYRITDPDEQVRVAQDFIAILAQIHRLDPRTLALPSFGAVTSARQHAEDRIEGIRWRGTAPDGSMDPLLRLSLDWLESNVPEYDEPTVVVQGDTGPGNFMYADGKVTAVVDWELSHFGDPMDDIAWLSLRTVQDTFTHLPDRLREYEAQSGHPIDVDRVWYYRVFAEATMATLRPNEGRHATDAGDADDGDAGRPAARDIGNGILYRQLHRRLWLEALNQVMGLELPPPETPVAGDISEWHHFYDDVLGSLQVIVPRVSDPLASQWSKGVARVVKYLKEIDGHGRLYDELERSDIAPLIGHRPDSLDDGRAQLAELAQVGKVGAEDYVRVLWNKVMRDDHLMRTASGALHERTWPPLT